jgi:hypothetical protein
MSWAIGLDIAGPGADRSALAIVQRVPRPVANGEVKPLWGGDDDEYHVLWLHRWPPKMPGGFLALVQGVGEIVNRLRRERRVVPTLVVDVSGIGYGVLDWIGDAALAVESVVAVNIIAGAVETASARGLNVPKRELIVATQSALESGALKVAAKLPEKDALLNELRSYEVDFSDAGRALMGARKGAHDDLVNAVALAVYWLRRSDRASGVQGWMEAEAAREHTAGKGPPTGRDNDGEPWLPWHTKAPQRAKAEEEVEDLYHDVYLPTLYGVVAKRRGRLCDGETSEGVPCNQPLGPSHHNDGVFYWHPWCRPPRGTT